MTARRSDYVVVTLKALNGIADEIATTKEYAKKKAVSFANRNNEVMLVVQVLHVFVPEPEHHLCEIGGCNNPAVIHYCEEHDGEA